MSTAMITQTKLFLEKKTPDLVRWSRGGVQASALTMLALQELSNTPAIRDATPQSVYCALLACAISGLEPGSLKQEAFLVPFKRRLPDSDQWITEVKFLCGWRGIVKQATRAGGILWIRSAVVHEGDVFEIDNVSDRPLVHRPRIGTARGPVQGAFAIAKLTNGEFQHEWLDLERLQQIRKFANAKKPSPAWEQWPEEMYRKSAVRALGKYLPMDETYFNAARLEHAQEATEGPTEIEVLDLLTDGAASADAADGGPIAGFVAAAPAVVAPSALRTTGKAKDKAPPIDAKATEVRPTPPAASPSSSVSSPSPTTDSISAPSSAPTGTSKPAPSALPLPPADPADEPGSNDDEDEPDETGGDPFAPPAFEPPAPAKICGFPASLAGCEAWIKSCKLKQTMREEIPQWHAWFKNAGFDAGYKPTGPNDPTPAREMAPELARMNELFNAQWKVAK